MKLIGKERNVANIRKTFTKPKTPYQMVLDSKTIDQKTKQRLKELYQSLNPAELKRQIDKKKDELYQAYKRKKNQSLKIEVLKERQPLSVTFLNDLTEVVSVT